MFDPDCDDPGPGDLTTRVLVEIRDDLRGQRDLLFDQGRRLDRHEQALLARGELIRQQGETLLEISGILREHGEILREHGGRLREQGGALRQLLRAVERGGARRQGRLDDHEERLRRLEELAGLIPPRDA